MLWDEPLSTHYATKNQKWTKHMLLNAELQLKTTEESLVSCSGELVKAKSEVKLLKEEVDQLKTELHIYQTIEAYNLNGFIYLDLVRMTTESKKVHKLVKLPASFNEYNRFTDSVFTDDSDYLYAKFLDYDQVRKFKDSLRKAIIKNDQQVPKKSAG